MIIKSEYVVDLFQFSKTSDKEGLLEYHEVEAGRKIGDLIIKNFPSEKDNQKSFKGNQQNIQPFGDAPLDYYRNEIFVSSREFIETLYDKCNKIFDPLLRSEVCNFLKDEMRKTCK